MNSTRRDTIKEYIDTHGEVKVKELEEMFPGTSSMTIRRDLTFLENTGYIVRTMGGAKSIKHLSKTMEDIYSLRAMTNTDAKEKIAQKAVKFMEEGRSIFIDSGTTMMCLAKILPDKNYSILADGPNISMEIIKKNNPNVMLVGGQLSRNTISASGPNSMLFIDNVNIDIAFMATSGFSLKSGFTSGDLNECKLKEAVIKKAGKVIMLMDISKLNKNMPFTFATLDDIDILVCDSPLPREAAKEIRQYNVDIY